MVEGEEEYELEAILKHKGKGARRLYLVMWKGYPIIEASWEPESHLRNAPLILEDYFAMSVLKINTNDRPEETKEAVGGGPGVIEASGAFNNDGPTLVDEVSAGEIAFGALNLRRNLYRLCIGLLTTGLI